MNVVMEVYELRAVDAATVHVGLRQIIIQGEQEQIGGYIVQTVPKAETPALFDRLAGTLAPEPGA